MRCSATCARKGGRGYFKFRGWGGDGPLQRTLVELDGLSADRIFHSAAAQPGDVPAMCCGNGCVLASGTFSEKSVTRYVGCVAGWEESGWPALVGNAGERLSSRMGREVLDPGGEWLEGKFRLGSQSE